MPIKRFTGISTRHLLDLPEELEVHRSRVRIGKVIEFPREPDAAAFERLLPGFSARIETLHGRGLSVRQILEELREYYGVDVTREAMLEVCDSLQQAARQWRQRPLAPRYAFVFVDSISVRVRELGGISDRTVHIALGILPDGGKDIIAFWFTPGTDIKADAEFWSRATAELKNRGVRDVLVAVAEDKANAAEAVQDAFPGAAVLTGPKHLIGRALATVASKDKIAMGRALDKTCAAADGKAAKLVLAAFADETLGQRYPEAVAYWRQHWNDIAAFYALPPAVREVVRTTTAIESLTAKLRRRGVTRRGGFASEEDAIRHLILGLRDAGSGWKVAPGKWTAVRTQLVRQFAGRYLPD